MCCREDSLKQEVKDVEARCQRAEQRHADLVATMPSATQPLLRQLDALQVCRLLYSVWVARCRQNAACVLVSSGQDLELPTLLFVIDLGHANAWQSHRKMMDWSTGKPASGRQLQWHVESAQAGNGAMC